MGYISKSLLTAALVLLFFASTYAQEQPVGSIRAIVNDVIITDEAVFRRAHVALTEAYQKYKGQAFEQKSQEIMQAVLLELIDRQVLVQEATRTFKNNPAAMEAMEKQLDDFMKGTVKEVGSLTKFYELATKEGINPVEKKKELREDLMVDHLIREHVNRRISISPKEMRDYYQAHLSDFVSEKQVKLRLIFLRFVDFPTRAEAEKAANKIVQDAKAGKDFEALIRRYSRGPRAQEGGLWDFDEVKDLMKEIREAAQKLDAGQISDPIETPSGYFIIKVEEAKQARSLDFHAAQDEIYQKIFKEKMQAKKKEYIEELKKNATIRVFTGNF